MHITENSNSIPNSDPIDEWLSTPALTNVHDGLAWWSTMIQTKHPLAQIASDFLSAPGMGLHHYPVITLICSHTLSVAAFFSRFFIAWEIKYIKPP